MLIPARRLSFVAGLGYVLSFPFQYLLQPQVHLLIDLPRFLAAGIGSALDMVFIVLVFWLLKINRVKRFDIMLAAKIVSISVVTVVCAEYFATNTNVWVYNEAAIVVPYLKILTGALVHYLLVPVFTMYMAVKLTKVS